MFTYILPIDIKKVDKQLNVVYGTIRYGRCNRNPLSGPLLFIYNNIYLYIYILIITSNFNELSILKIFYIYLLHALRQLLIHFI